MNTITIRTSPPLFPGELPPVVETLPDAPIGTVVVHEGRYRRRCAAPIREPKRSWFGRQAPPPRGEREAGEWTVLTGGYEIIGEGPYFEDRFRATGGLKVWGGYDDLDRARRDAAGLARRFDAQLLETI